MRSKPSLRRFPNIAFETVPMFVRLTMIRSHLLNEGRRPFSFYVSLLHAIDGVMSMCQQALSQAHQHFRFSKMQATCSGWYLFPPAYLHGHFPSLWHVQSSIPVGILEGGYRTSTPASLGFPFHLSPIVGSSLSL